MAYYDSDVVIVGGGLAGMVTALELLRQGVKVTLLDRDVPEHFGGLARLSFGGIFLVDTPSQRLLGAKDSPEQALKDWHAFAEFGPEDIWPRRWAESYVYGCRKEVYEWLRGEGIRFLAVVHWVERGLFRPGNAFPRFHMVWGTGHELVRVLRQKLQPYEASGQFRVHFRHHVQTLLTGEGRVLGVRGIEEESKETFEAMGKAIVVATGGVCGDIERVRREWYRPWGTPPEVLLNGSHPYANGELHDAVRQIGGSVTHLDKMWLYAAGVHHPRPHFPGHGLSLVPPKSALWVNYRGERIGDPPLVSGFDTRYLVERICQQEKKYSWQILNWKIARKELAVSGAEYNPAVRDKQFFRFLRLLLFGNPDLVRELIATCPDFVVAQSVEELADAMNALTGTSDVDVQVLAESIRAYDDNIRRGRRYHNDDQLRRIAHLRRYRGDRLRTCAFQPIDDPGARPLIAIREFILTRKSLGGIQTDLACRVLTPPDTDGRQRAIPGLFAVGEAAGFGGGGIHGLRALEGTFLGSCIFTGRKAAHAIIGQSL